MNDALDRIGAARVVPVLTVDERGRGGARVPRARSPAGCPSSRSRFAPTRLPRRSAGRRRSTGLLVGAGTMLSPEQLEAALEAGAQFAVAPANERGGGRGGARSAGVPFVPGVGDAVRDRARARARLPRASRSSPPRCVGGPGVPARRSPRCTRTSRFVPTGGVNAEQPRRRISPLPSVLACGGTLDLRAGAPARGPLRRDRAARARGSRDRRGRVSGSRCRAEECRWDLVALGEVMLPLRSRRRAHRHDAHASRVWEGGGEYNVARGLRRCFGLRTAIVTAFADNPVGRLVEDLILPGRRRPAHVRWVPYDGVGRERAQRPQLRRARLRRARRARLLRPRPHAPRRSCKPGDVDWDAIFGRDGARWFHTGGIFAALSRDDAARRARGDGGRAPARHGRLLRSQLPARRCGRRAAARSARREVNRALVELVDVLLGNEEDFSAALGFEVEGVDENLARARRRRLRASCIERCSRRTRTSRSSRPRCARRTPRRVNDWGARLQHARRRSTSGRGCDGLEIFDRVGGGDSFASGLIYGLLDRRRSRRCALDYGVAHGALAMTTPGDTTMATLAEVERVMRGGAARVVR